MQKEVSTGERFLAALGMTNSPSVISNEERDLEQTYPLSISGLLDVSAISV